MLLSREEIALLLDGLTLKQDDLLTDGNFTPEELPDEQYRIWALRNRLLAEWDHSTFELVTVHNIAVDVPTYRTFLEITGKAFEGRGEGSTPGANAYLYSNVRAHIDVAAKLY